MNTETTASDAERARTREAFSYMSTDDFRAHLRAIIGPQPKPTPAERPCVRTPADAGYYPPFDAKREHERDLEHESREAFRQLEMGGA